MKKEKVDVKDEPLSDEDMPLVINSFINLEVMLTNFDFV